MGVLPAKETAAYAARGGVPTYFVEALELGSSNFPTQRGGCFFSSTHPGSKRTEDIAESNDPSPQPVILPIMSAKGFTD